MIKISNFVCLKESRSAIFFNRFVNEIFGNLFYQTFGRRRYFHWFLTKKNSKNVYFLLQNRHLKHKIDCKNKAKWKLQTHFSRNYNFAFTNLLKNAAALAAWTPLADRVLLRHMVYISVSQTGCRDTFVFYKFSPVCRQITLRCHCEERSCKFLIWT